MTTTPTEKAKTQPKKGKGRSDRKTPESIILGKKIYDLRIERGYSASDVHRTSGVSTSYIRDIESGGVPHPSLFRIAAIARALNVSVLYFLNDQEYTEACETKDIKLLHDLDFLDMARSPEFQRYLSVMNQAYSAGVSPEKLIQMIDLLTTPPLG